MGGNGHIFSKTVLNEFANDAEVWSYDRQIAVGVVYGAVTGLTANDCGWDASGGGKPCLIFFDVPQDTVITNNSFQANRAGQAGIPEPTSYRLTMLYFASNWHSV